MSVYPFDVQSEAQTHNIGVTVSAPFQQIWMESCCQNGEIAI